MLYLTFEDVYRGAREEIRSRQSVYLPLLQEHKIGSPTMPVLDIGCGRGEWLELLRENGLNARGVDTNEAMVEYCRRLDLKVTQADAIEHLRGLEGRSLGAVTVFHVLEHLTFDNVIELLDEALRVLKPGGLVILETPNPANLLVGAHTFYLDPTHQRPLPSGLLRFLVEARGFCDVSVKELNPPDPSVRLPEDGSIIARRLNDYLYGPQDYAVIGWKL
jgi:O-antigen chain-terminating methyltransferase